MATRRHFRSRGRLTCDFCESLDGIDWYCKICNKNFCTLCKHTHEMSLVYKNVILIYKFSLVIHAYYSISLKCQVFQIDGILFFNGVSILFFLWIL
jgi:hypothetical protein